MQDVRAFFKRSQVVMDPADKRFTHSLDFPFNVKGNAMNITWSLDTPRDWKRLTIDVIFEMGLTTPGPLSSLTLVRYSLIVDSGGILQRLEAFVASSIGYGGSDVGIA
ncbi:hypothetical protein Tco_1056274 [Tanacetum coccineum]|uniref:Uncharacterized protein n=1 Tax=Tanacetum coccineum TaxID=301880 RepID=A0ABQ5H216_9ASTR